MKEIKRRINGDSFNFRLREASGIVLGARPRCRARAPRRLGASKTPRRPRPRTPPARPPRLTRTWSRTMSRYRLGAKFLQGVLCLSVVAQVQDCLALDSCFLAGNSFQIYDHLYNLPIPPLCPSYIYIRKILMCFDQRQALSEQAAFTNENTNKIQIVL